MIFFRIKSKQLRVKKVLIALKRAMLFCFLVLYSFFSFGQDSIPAAKDLTEEKELKFQQFFFKALSEKSIGNYKKAIVNLENCNQILSNEMAVFFEFSKNYLLLKNNLLAKEYIKRAIEKDTNNIWMLKHLVKVQIKDSRFGDAINTQKKIVEINEKENLFLVRLYFQNKEYEKAYSLMDFLEQKNGLPAELKRLKQRFEKRKKPVLVEEKVTDVSSLILEFKTDKSYAILKQILNNSSENPTNLLKYSEEGISLFPAQPYVYLMKGKALNYHKKYKKALVVLESGFDFVIEDTMETNFYIEMAESYKGLGNLEEEKKHLKKAKKLKKLR